jgi:hypothetical protein
MFSSSSDTNWRSVHNILVRKPDVTRLGRRWNDNACMMLKILDMIRFMWLRVRIYGGALVSRAVHLYFYKKGREFLDWLSAY